jgi:hypothetical protein
MGQDVVKAAGPRSFWTANGSVLQTGKTINPAMDRFVHNDQDFAGDQIPWGRRIGTCEDDAAPAEEERLGDENSTSVFDPITQWVCPELGLG